MQATYAAALFAIPSAATLLAQTTPPPIPVEVRARFGFEGPLVAKIGDGIDTLRVADIDGDGRPEVLVADARRARVVALRVDGTTTKIDPIPTNGQIAAYTTADVHGDGKSDLIVVDSRGRLSVRHPGDTKSGAAIDLGLGTRGVVLLTGDLDGDRKADVVAVARGKMRHVTKLADTPTLSPIEPIDENAHSFHVTDVDGDDRLDVLCVVPGPSMNLRIRPGRGDGTFGPWRLCGSESLQSAFPARLGDGSRALATIEGPQRRVTLQEFGDHGDQQAPEWWSLGENQATKTLPLVVVDVDNDGDQDIVLAQPERAQLLVYTWDAGTFVSHTVPTLAGVAALAAGDVDKDGKIDLVLTSPEEDTVAWMSGAVPIDRFPVQVACTDKPIAAAVHPEGGLVVLARTEKRDAHLDRVTADKEPERLADLGRVPADPVRLIVADVGDAPGLEVSFVVPGEGLRTVTLGAEPKKGGKTAETAGFTKKLDDGALTLCEHAGRPALLAVRDRFVRRFRVDGKGQLQVLTQDNGPEGFSELTLAAEVAGGGGLYLDKKNNKLVRTTPGSADRTTDVPALDFTQMLAHGDAAILVGPKGILRVPFGTGPSLRSVAVHEPPTDRTFYWDGASGDFDHDGVADLLLIDRHLPGAQVLAGGPNGLVRALAIPVFETPPSSEPDSEPRDLVTGDLDGDGRIDFALIAHDRVLIYLQEK